MALHGLRDTTRDVDTIKRIDDAVRTAVAIVADRRGFEVDWLNDRAAAYWPQGLTIEQCALFRDYPKLRVYVPPPRFVFVMKLYAGRQPFDHADMVALWPRCDFESAQDAVDQYAAAYPHEDDDPHLRKYVEQIAKADDD